MGQVADTLAGRAIYLELPPFCPAEWQQRKDALLPLDRLFASDFDFREWPAGTGDWPAWLLRGGFPPVLAIASDSDRALWFAAYVQTYLERDLRQLSAVSSLPDFQRVMALAARRTGRLLNQADLARDAALTHPTTHRYPERFAQEALGHNSKAVHRAYSRKAKVKLPSLENYEKQAAAGNVIPFQLTQVLPVEQQSSRPQGQLA